jgi:CRP-like cAMP-binding protein
MPQLSELANMLDDTKWGHYFERYEIENIASYMTLMECAAGEVIFGEGDREHYMAFIVEGEVDIRKESSDNTERIVVTLTRRTHFGEMAFIDDEPRSATAVARTQVTLLVLSKDNFENLLEFQPKLGIKILKLIARLISQRLRETTGKLVFVRS